MDRDGIYTVLKPSLYAARLFGLAPFSLETKRSVHAYSLVTIALFVVFCYGTGQTVLSFYNNPILPKFEKLMLFLQLTVTSSLTLASWITNHRRYNSLIQILDSISNIEEMIQSLNIEINFKDFVRFQYYLLPGVAAIAINNFVDNILLNENPFGIFILYTIAKLTLSHFLQPVLVLNKYYALLNNQLCILGNFRSDGIPKDISKLPRKTFSEQIQKVYSKPTKENRYIVKRITEIHRHIGKVCNDLNNYFGIQILLSVLVNILNVTSICFYVPALVIDQSDKPHHYLFISIVTVSAIAVYSFAELWTTVYICSSTTKEAKFSAVLVHGLLNKEEFSAIREDLLLFSTQLLHQNTVFSACSFFTLDFALINAIIGVAITYIVILIQFQMSN